MKPHMRHAGIAKPGAADLFRHAMATHMMEAGADIPHLFSHLNPDLIPHLILNRGSFAGEGVELGGFGEAVDPSIRKNMAEPLAKSVPARPKNSLLR